MTIEKLKASNELSQEIDWLEYHIQEVMNYSKLSEVGLQLILKRSGTPIELAHSPKQVADFIDKYIVSANDRLKELQAQFEQL